MCALKAHGTHRSEMSFARGTGLFYEAPIGSVWKNIVMRAVSAVAYSDHTINSLQNCAKHTSARTSPNGNEATPRDTGPGYVVLIGSECSDSVEWRPLGKR